VQSKLGHILLNVRPENLGFYNDLFAFLGWEIVYSGDEMLGVKDANDASLWFGTETNAATNDYDGPGVNHLAIHTATQSDVDAAVDYLRGHDVTPLFETPRHRPDFASSEDHTYYQVMFESPDRILWEIVYVGPKEA
jgi:catechol 2,3-dioxygenase-like lactoylglutathione lyase family enzyme